MSDLLVIPIFNKSVTLFPGPLLSLSDTFSVEKISGEEHSAFFLGASEEIKSGINIKKTKCIKIRTIDPSIDLIRMYRTKAVFVLNIFSDFNPIITSWCGHLNEGKILKLKEITKFESLSSFHFTNSNGFKFSKNHTRSAIINFFEVVKKAITNTDTLLFTLEKYNSALMRENFTDQLLDTAICFETMNPGNTELVYRLSQNIAFMIGSSPEEKVRIFDDMKKLYDVRSKLVHGDLKNASKKVEEVKASWIIYQKYLKAAVTYYVMFLSQKRKEEWEQHIKELIFGKQTKIIA